MRAMSSARANDRASAGVCGERPGVALDSGQHEAALQRGQDGGGQCAGIGVGAELAAVAAAGRLPGFSWPMTAR